ncbi:MAG: alpha/beta hydrolase fold domain-containing protein [Pseudonocardia sp.]
MGTHGLPPEVLRPGLRAFSRWALSPSLSWPTTRRRVEVALRFPGPPRDVLISSRSVGGVPCEVHRPPRARSDESTTLYLHGGGWTFGSALAWRSLAGRLATALRQRVIVPDYRLTPDWPYDAQVADVRAVWDAVSAEAGPGATTAVGDSAGGQLALVLTLGLTAERRPLPRALGLICPAVDMTSEALAANGPGEREPLLTPLLMQRCYAAVLNGADPRDPRFSPIYADLAGLPPIVLDTGEDDLIRRDGLRLAEAARAAGVTVDHVDHPGLWHVPHLSAPLMAGAAGLVVERFAARLRTAA